ncbi:hypothetical protein AMK34_07100 [Amycolatopsis sp. CB00013]|nr:hypothetical protein AMK34_07100 [Amycolatopsis sp. CB00013]
MHFTGEESRDIAVVPRMQRDQGDLPVGGFFEGPGEHFLTQRTAVHPDHYRPGVMRSSDDHDRAGGT